MPNARKKLENFVLKNLGKTLFLCPHARQVSGLSISALCFKNLMFGKVLLNYLIFSYRLKNFVSSLLRLTHKWLQQPLKDKVMKAVIWFLLKFPMVVLRNLQFLLTVVSNALENSPNSINHHSVIYYVLLSVVIFFVIN